MWGVLKCFRARRTQALPALYLVANLPDGTLWSLKAVGDTIGVDGKNP
jgi:hypothetical protein